jgi:purine-binding chemotaxis protein CheW
MQLNPKSQFVSFFVGDRFFGIDVLKVQEVTSSLPITHVPTGPRFVVGLINLRGQICVAISLHRLFKLDESSGRDSARNQKNQMNQINIVCYYNELLISFLVDSVGDVLELKSGSFESAPETISQDVRRYLDGVFKTPGALMSIVDVQSVGQHFESITKELTI